MEKKMNIGSPTRFNPKWFFLLALALGSASFFALGQDDQRGAVANEEAEDYYRKWVEQDVVYLITDDERKVFKSLTTDDEKDSFIEQFWRRRDTDLSTSANEYREEHYRRIAYANQEFGSGIPGWKTDRGRIYIMFGPPDETEYHAGGENYVRKPWEGGGTTATFPFEYWRYRFIDGVGEDIELEFVDRSWTGEFKLALYPWEKDMLMQIDGMGETTAERLGMTPRWLRPGLHPGNLNNTAYMKRYLGERFKDRPFERMRVYFDMQRPPVIKQKELQAIVGTNISYTMLPFSTAIHNVWIDEGLALVPITLLVENRNLTFFKEPSNYKARIGIYGRVTTMLGELQTEFEDTVSVEYPHRYATTLHKLKSTYQKSLSLYPGVYKLEMVVKDFTSGDIGTLTRGLDLKSPQEGTLTVGSLILADKIDRLEEFAEAPISFVIGDMRVVPNVTQTFRKEGDLGVYLQVYNADLDSSTLLPSLVVKYSLTQGREVVTELLDEDGSSVEFSSARRVVLAKKFDLGDFEPGKYQVSVSVEDRISGQKIMSEGEFDIIEVKEAN